MVRFWRGMYSRHESGVHPREALADVLRAGAEHTNALRYHTTYLTQVITHAHTYIQAYKYRRAHTPTHAHTHTRIRIHTHTSVCPHMPQSKNDIDV